MTQGKRLRLERMGFKKDLAKKREKKIKFREKNECKALQIFKIWYTRNKLSANVFLKTKALNNIRRLNDEQRIIQKFI